MDVKRLGSAIRDRRLALDYSQEDLARRANTSSAYISRLERGQYEEPGARILDRVMRALGAESWQALLESSGAALEPPATYGGAGRTLTEEDLAAIEERFMRAFERMQRRDSEDAAGQGAT